MAALDSFYVNDAVLNLLRYAFDPSVFLGHRRREYGQCPVSLLSYLGMRNVTDLWKARLGTTGIPLWARLALP